jgi:hypothetical protein
MARRGGVQRRIVEVSYRSACVLQKRVEETLRHVALVASGEFA